MYLNLWEQQKAQIQAMLKQSIFDNIFFEPELYPPIPPY